MLEEKILNDYQQAMKNKDTLRASVLSFLRAQMINLSVAKKKKSLDDNDAMTVIRKQVKAHQDSIEQFKKGARQDLVDKETKELDILKSYLPPELSLDELKIIIEEAITLTQAKDIKDMGRVMKEVTAKVAGRADAKLISDLVREILRGFTLIELMLVVIIIGILSAMVMPRLAGRSEQARIQAAKSDINSSLSLALDLYEMDMGSFPENLDDLHTKPSAGENWRGPYIKKKPLDPWGRSYAYKFPGEHNQNSYDLYSLGKDGESDTSDDIKNWE